MTKFYTTVQIKYNWAINNIRIPTSKYHCPHQFRITNIHQLFKDVYFAVPKIYKIQK